MTSITYNASVYLDIRLQPLLRTIPTFIQDSASLILHLADHQFPKSCWFLEADVESLYPSIVITDGLLSLEKFLLSHQVSQPEILFILDLTHWVLSNNFLKFGNNHFLQIQGTAMGTPVAVAFACIHLAIIEDEIQLQSLEQETYTEPLLI